MSLGEKEGGPMKHAMALVALSAIATPAIADRCVE
jgi:hypothetical protein